MTEAWAPTLEDVGTCIPTRTANVNLPGDDTYLGTFTSDTRPTDTQAQNRIDKAVNDVIAACTGIDTNLEPAAKNAAMWRAAADLELAYPDRNADANYYAQLDARARYEWDLFLKAAAQQGDTVASAVPQWYMPQPPWWGDRTDI